MEEKKYDDSPDVVAKRLRDKIRLQAESLLGRVDDMERGRDSLSKEPSSNNVEFSSGTSTPGGGATGDVSLGMSSAATVATPPRGTPSRTASNNSLSNGNSSHSATATATNNNNELTKRLQKLAVDRQKVSEDRLKVVQGDANSHLSSAKTFQELNLPDHLLSAIFAMGFDRPSAIQEEALPRILAGRNLIGQAQSGSGKSAAFCLGMLYRITVDTPATVQALCVSPTRELAIQIVDKAVVPMAANMKGFKVQLAIAQTASRTVDAHLVVGTPGKIVDWMKRRVLKPNNIKTFVLDEADEMVGVSGHRANSLLIKKQLPPACQSLFFSATFSDEVVNFAERMVTNPDKILIEDGPEYLVLDVIKQLWVDTRTYQGGKLEFLADIYSLLTIGQSIIFVETKKSADTVHSTLTASGYTCSVLHGAVEPAMRDTVMEAYRNGQSNVLITTNVLARGVDVDNVCLVINYDPPTDKEGNPDFETYLHRIGRTGRFGRRGTAINLIGDESSVQVLAAIERHFAVAGREMIQQAYADPEALAEVIEI